MADEREVTDAVENFYLALEELLRGHTERMAACWHHGPDVSTVHPLGNWAWGWHEVWASWQEICAMSAYYHGHANRTEPIGRMCELRVAVSGDSARTICVYHSALYMPEGEFLLKVNCTNVLERHQGIWKIVHHHPDQAPAEFQAALQRMVERGEAYR